MAMNNLGVCYHTGKGVVEDHAKAFFLVHEGGRVRRPVVTVLHRLVLSERPGSQTRQAARTEVDPQGHSARL